MVNGKWLMVNSQCSVGECPDDRVLKKRVIKLMEQMYKIVFAFCLIFG